MDLFNQPYFNTTGLSGTELKQRKAKAGTQNAEVLELFQIHGKMSASQCWQKMGKKCPLTSVRRAISSLKLEKTDEMVLGEYGASEHVYRIVL